MAHTRRCKCCDRKLDPLEEAIRVATCKDSSGSAAIGHMRYWLCWRCAKAVEDAIPAIRRIEYGAKAAS